MGPHCGAARLQVLPAGFAHRLGDSLFQPGGREVGKIWAGFGQVPQAEFLFFPGNTLIHLPGQLFKLLQIGVPRPGDGGRQPY